MRQLCDYSATKALPCAAVAAVTGWQQQQQLVTAGGRDGSCGPHESGSGMGGAEPLWSEREQAISAQLQRNAELIQLLGSL